MKKITFILLALLISACGGAPSGDVTPVPVAPPAPAPAPVDAPPVSDTPEIAAAPAWSDLESIEALMEANGRSMKQLKVAVQQNDAAAARPMVAELRGRFEELERLSRSFTGAEPDRFRGFASNAAIAARDLDALLAKDSAPVAPAETRRLFEGLQGACKNCHDVYHKH